MKKMFLYIFTLAFAVLASAEILEIFDDVDHSGDSHRIAYSRGACHLLPPQWNDRASSVNTYGSCVWLFEHQYCDGRSIRVAPDTHSHNNLVALNFNDMASSFQKCYNTNTKLNESTVSGQFQK